MVRGHVPSAATKAKISLSLKGNKNAFRGGPKRKLTAREKVANINARTTVNKARLSDEQLVRRRKVAQRLRVQARKDEAGQSSHSTPLPTPAHPAPKQVIEDRETKAVAKGSVPAGNMKANTGGTSDRVNPADKRKALEIRAQGMNLAENYQKMHGDAGVRKKIAQLDKSNSSTDLLMSALLKKQLLSQGKSIDLPDKASSEAAAQRRAARENPVPLPKKNLGTLRPNF